MKTTPLNLLKGTWEAIIWLLLWVTTTVLTSEIQVVTLSAILLYAFYEYQYFAIKTKFPKFSIKNAPEKRWGAILWALLAFALVLSVAWLFVNPNHPGTAHVILHYVILARLFYFILSTIAFPQAAFAPSNFGIIGEGEDWALNAFRAELAKLTHKQLEQMNIELGIQTPGSVKEASRSQLEMNVTEVAWYKYLAAYSEVTGKPSVLDPDKSAT